MTQTLTSRVKAIKNDPGTGEAVQIAEINSAFDKFDNHFVPAAMLRQSAGISIANITIVDIDFNQVAHDTYAARAEGAMADIALNQIVIRRAGAYMLTASSSWVVNGTGQRRLFILVNGAIVITDEQPGAAGGSVVTKCSVPLVLAVNDIVKAQYRQSSGGALASDANGAINGVHLSASWFGAGVEV